MNYTLDIIDTVNSNLLTKEEAVGASSVILNYFGGDNKEELKIVPSSVSFAMMGLTNQEGEYIHLFTSDETRYMGHLYDENNVTIWKGYLLPDSYSEPYASGAILIDFEAVDGLARLKGKYLPADFYSEEKSVIALIAECLKLTGLDLDIWFSPAIVNLVQQDYSQIFDDTSALADGEKKENAYKVLEDLMKDMLCVLFQEDGVWKMEGLNIREQMVYNTHVFNSAGVYIEEKQVTRTIKTLDALGEPEITMRPPYGKITVTHKKEAVSLPEGLMKLDQDRWASFSASTDQNDVLLTEWVGDEDDHIYAAEGKAMLARASETQAVEPISFRSRPYLRKGERYKLTLGFKIIQANDLDAAQIETIRRAGHWTDPFPLYFWLGEDSTSLPENVLMVNSDILPNAMEFSISFDKDGAAEQTIEFVPDRNGSLTAWIYRFGQTLTEADDNIASIEITKLELEHITFKEEDISVIESSEEYTTELDLELTTADDAAAESRAFRLAKLRAPDTYVPFYLDIYRQFLFKGSWYAIVPLKVAHLVEHNPEVYNGGNAVNVQEVLYNFLGSQEHALRLDAELYAATGEVPQIEVRVYKYTAVPGDRSSWEQWSDVIYGIEADKYSTAAAKVLHRCTNNSIPVVRDLTCLNNMKFGDMAVFPYNNRDKWIITGLSWNLDEGESTIGISQAYYTAFIGDQFPPTVRIYSDNMQGDIAFFDVDTFTLHSDSYSPQGFIVDHNWQILEGSGTIDNPSQESITITGATSGYYRVQLTVTDNEGMTAVQTIEVYKFYTVDLQLVYQGQTGSVRTSKLEITPDITQEHALNIQGFLTMYADNIEDFYFLEIQQNGAVIGRITGKDFKDGFGKITVGFSIGYLAGDEIIVRSQTFDESTVTPATAYVQITKAVFAVGYGTVTGVNNLGTS